MTKPSKLELPMEYGLPIPPFPLFVDEEHWPMHNVEGPVTEEYTLVAGEFLPKVNAWIHKPMEPPLGKSIRFFDDNLFYNIFPEGAPEYYCGNQESVDLVAPLKRRKIEE